MCMKTVLFCWVGWGGVGELPGLLLVQNSENQSGDSPVVETPRETEGIHGGKYSHLGCQCVWLPYTGML